MFKDDQFTKMKKQYDEITVPHSIDEYIKRGIQKENKRKKVNSRIFAAIATAACLFIAFVSLAAIPSVSNLASNVPGLHLLLGLNQDERAPEDWAYKQKIGKSETKNGITLTVDEIEADESKLTIYYSFTSDKAFEHMNNTSIVLLDENGDELEAVYSYSSFSDGEGFEAGERKSLSVDVSLVNAENFPSELTFETYFAVKPSDKEIENERWAVTFDINEKKIIGNKESFPLNKTVEIDGQKLTIKKVTMYPTTFSVEVEFDKNNTKRIFGFDDMDIVDSEGNSIIDTSSFGGPIISKDERIINFDNPSRKKHKEIYLQFSSIRALDKDKLEVVIDLEERKLIKGPDENLKLYEINKEEEYIEIGIGYEKNTSPYNLNSYLSFENLYADDNGAEYIDESYDYSFRTSAENVTYYWKVSSENLKNSRTVKLYLADYPSRINKETRIKIK